MVVEVLDVLIIHGSGTLHGGPRFLLRTHYSDFIALV